MTAFLVLSQLVLSVSIKEAVGLGNVFNLVWLEEEALVGLATEVIWVDLVSLSLGVNDVLMVEVLDGSHEVLAVIDWNLTLSFFITSNVSPNVGEEELFALHGDWTHEAELEEDLRHLSAVNKSIWTVILVLDDLKVHTNLVEIIVKSVMHNLIGPTIDLGETSLLLLLKVLLEHFLLNHSSLGVRENIVHTSVHSVCL